MTVKTLQFDTTRIPRELGRTEVITQSRPAPHTAQRSRVDLGSVVDALSRRGVAAAKAEIVNSVLAALVDLLYQSEPEVGPVNFERMTGRILVPLPWSNEGVKVWGLRSTEGRALRKIMLNRTMIDDPAPWLDLDAGSNRWRVNLDVYGQKRTATGYVLTYPVTVKEWVRATEATRSQWSREHGIGDD